MTEIGVAVAQFAPTDDKAANLAAIRALVKTAAQRGARLVVLPEYASHFANPLGPASVEAAESFDGAFVAALTDLAVEFGVYLVAGMLETSDDPERFSNTLVAVSPANAVVASYRKMHLYDAFGQRESDWVVPGPVAEPETFTVDGVVVGLQTCYDLRFPEVTRRVVDAGAQLVVVPSEWVRGPLKEHHWRTFVTARALENTVYVAAADHVPPVGVGNSMVVDPMGVELVTIGDETDVAVAHIRVDRIERVRAVNPALALRRFTVVPR
ncbi:carbon-nitrogen hydrolase family protein [Compostimonas suwonensis]|uniref:Putative amidohydrolase n=1 Tax=Compostimonas suwonensis TaxID=1048394 RepID=A0A2M9BWL9_9MICO|nr:carbon-nitrogen hydrolase family protein [Compostimonas suwonensis]PJJ62340.1 putative amidohydrolase [Compostimonas suwonensis]